MIDSENRALAARFQSGVPGNPDGRPKGLASYVRDVTGDGEDLVDFFVSSSTGAIASVRLPRRYDGAWRRQCGWPIEDMARL